MPKKAMTLTGLMLFVALAVPPWQNVWQFNRSEAPMVEDAGYGLIFSPPKAEPTAARIEVGFGRLWVEVAAICVLGFLLGQLPSLHDRQGKAGAKEAEPPSQGGTGVQ
jgi:hypothetical protein